MSKVYVHSNQSFRSARSALVPFAVRSALVALAACLVPVSGCSSQTAETEDAARLEGSVSMALTLEGGYKINAVNISFESPALPAARQRVVNVTDPNATLSFAEHGLPAGTYGIKLTAALADVANAPCTGEATGIVVQAGQVTEVNNLVLTCTVQGGKVTIGGSVRVNARATVDVKPGCTDLVDQASISALQTGVGSTVNLLAVAKPGATVTWTANAGTVSADGTTFTCPAVAGQVALRADFAGANSCTDKVEQIVSCVRAPQFRLGEGAVQQASITAGSANALYGVAFDSAGNFYTSGPLAETPSADQFTAVTKFKADGSIDTTFGDAGVAKVNVGVGANEAFRGIAVQTVGGTSYIVVAGATQFNAAGTSPANLEQDTALARFTLAGVLDTSFGNSGVVRINMNSGVPNAAGTGWTGNESVWDLIAAPDGKLIIHGSQRNDSADGTATPLTNAVYALLRLNADGSPDTSFDGDGKVTLNMNGAGAGARTATLLADGSVVGVGYTSNAPGVLTQNPVLYKVTPAGAFDTTFATQDAWTAPGVWHDQAVGSTPARGAESYAAGPQGANFVTMGYGQPPVQAPGGSGTDFVSFRFTGAGVIDRTYGKFNGATYIDGEGRGDNGRARVIVLPDNQVVGAGGGGRVPAAGGSANTDGMIALLSEGGIPVEAFGAGGRRLVDLGGANDFLHAAALSPDASQVVFVGQGGSGSALKGVVVRLALLPAN